MLRRILYLAMLLLLFVSAGGGAIWWRWDYLGGVRGDLAARYDLARGRTNLVWNGLADQEGPEVRRILWEVYGVRVLPLFGCVVYPPQLEYMESYNQRMLSHTAERFGGWMLERVYEEARWNVAEAPNLTEQQRDRQSARYELALPRTSPQDLPILIPLPPPLPKLRSPEPQVTGHLNISLAIR